MPYCLRVENRDAARKSLVAAKAIKVGEILVAEDLICKRPGTGASPTLYWQMLGQTATRSYVDDEALDG